MLAAVRLALRITTDALDDEIRAIIEAGKLDLSLSGVRNIDVTDPLIVRAVTLYTKANFGVDPDSEKYQRSYDALKRALCLSGDYNTKSKRKQKWKRCDV